MPNQEKSPKYIVLGDRSKCSPTRKLKFLWYNNHMGLKHHLAKGAKADHPRGNRCDTLRTRSQVMSRQRECPESRLVCQPPKRERQQDPETHKSITTTIPKSLVTSGTPFNMSPFIRGFQDNMTSWMSNLMNQ